MNKSVFIRNGDKWDNSIENLEWVPSIPKPKQIKKNKPASKKPKK